MGIRNNTYSKSRKIISGIFIIILSGCYNIGNVDFEKEEMSNNNFFLENRYENDDTNNYNYINNNKYIYDYYIFYGVWILERIVLERDISYLLQTEEEIILYGLQPKRVNVKDFLGYELEITERFVRIGDRKLFYQEYIGIFSNLSMVSRFDFLFNPNIIWLTSYYNSPYELLKSLSNRGIQIGLNRESSEDVYAFQVEFIYFRDVYPFNHLWFSGRFSFTLDPDKPEYLFNPLFSTILVLSYDYMLVGLGGNQIVLARRIID